jgi:hypothetical protein
MANLIATRNNVLTEEHLTDAAPVAAGGRN